MEGRTDKHRKPGSEPAEPIVSQLVNTRAKFLGYIRKRISDPDAAEDILQDCYVKAIRSAPELRDEERIVQWFYRVLQNAITDAYRRRAAEANRIERYAIEVEDVADPDEERAICECLKELIPTLKSEYSEVVKSLDLDGEGPEAVANHLGISRNNLKVRAHRARQALRKRLEETCRVCATHHCFDCTCKQGESHSHHL